MARFFPIKKFNLSVAFTYDLHFFKFNINFIQHWHSFLNVLFNLDSRFLSSAFVLFKHNVVLSSSFVLFKRDVGVFTSILSLVSANVELRKRLSRRMVKLKNEGRM